MSGIESCVVKMGDREMEAKDIREFCMALMSMKDAAGNSRTTGMVNYMRVGKAIEQALSQGVPEESVVATVADALEKKGKDVDRAALMKAGDLYMKRKKYGNSDAGMSPEVRRGGGDFTAKREPMISENRLARYENMARRSGEELINVEMVIPSEILASDILGDNGYRYGNSDMAIATVYVNNSDGTPAYTESTDDDGNVQQVRKTGIRVYSYNHHRNGSTSDADKLVRDQVIAEAAMKAFQRVQENQLKKASKVKNLTDQLYRKATENIGGEYGGIRIAENKVQQKVEIGIDKDGKPVVIRKGLTVTDIVAKVRRPGPERQKA